MTVRLGVEQVLNWVQVGPSVCPSVCMTVRLGVEQVLKWDQVGPSTCPSVCMTVRLGVAGPHLGSDGPVRLSVCLHRPSAVLLGWVSVGCLGVEQACNGSRLVCPSICQG